jgi:AbrB family looped-hinge helix DNA binding protein
MTNTVTLSSKNQIVVPREARERLNIGPGHELLVLTKEDRVVLIPRPKNFVKHMAGLHQDVWQTLGAASYLKDERDAWDQ